MARYYEEAKQFANIIKDKNRLKAQIAGQSDTVQIGKQANEFFNIKDFNFTAKIRTVSADTIWGLATWADPDYPWDGTHTGGGFILGHPALGILGIGTLGANSGEWAVASRYKWTWNKQSELEDGTYDSNIDITNGDIRLAT